jgi:hypothetical protein
VLGASRRLSTTFPVIDDFAEGVATSLKSIDVTSASYQTGTSVVNKISQYARDLASFTELRQGSAAITAAETHTRLLSVVFEEGAVSSEQARALQALLRNAISNPTMFGAFPIKLVFLFIP